MIVVTRVVGACLILLGIVMFGITGGDSPTALLPAVLGAVLFALGQLGRREHVRRHAMHAAMALALLGIVGTGMNLTELPALLAGEAERPVAVIGSLVTALLLLVFLVLGIRSFVQARRAEGQ